MEKLKMKKQGMRLMNMKNYITGGTAIALSCVCFLAIFLQGYQKRLLMAGVFLFVAGCVSIIMAVKGMHMEENEMHSDEREEMIVEKSSKITLQIINRLIFSSTLFFILIYGITKIYLFFVVGIILCAITVAMLIILLITQKMLNKRV